MVDLDVSGPKNAGIHGDSGRFASENQGGLKLSNSGPVNFEFWGVYECLSFFCK